MSRVSIVLPCFNGERYLAGSIESCLAQTFSDWELILVDDASTDGTPALMERFAGRDPRIRALRHDRNRRLPAALNTGFEAATGAYLTWTSDDNRYRPNALAVLVDALDAHPDAGVVYADCTLVDADDRVLRVRRVPDRLLLLETNNPVGACFLYRRAVMETVGPYDESLFLSEDYDFWLRASARFPFMPVHQDLYLYRHHEGALTTRRADDIERTKRDALRRNLPALRWAPSAKRAESYLELAADARRRKAWATAVRDVLGALRCDPGFTARRLGGKLVGRSMHDDA